MANRKYSKFEHSVHGNNALRDGNDGFQQPGWFHDTLLGGGPSHTMEWGRSWTVDAMNSSQVMGAQVFMTPFLAAIYVVNPGDMSMIYREMYI